MNCVVCGISKTDKCHIKSRGSGGTDDEWNSIDMCRNHHQEQHRIGWFKFCDRYHRARKNLEAKGWKFEKIFDVWKLVRDDS